jgi:hypothetical protein
MGIYLAYDTQ